MNKLLLTLGSFFLLSFFTAAQAERLPVSDIEFYNNILDDIEIIMAPTTTWTCTCCGGGMCVPNVSVTKDKNPDSDSCDEATNGKLKN